MNELTNNNDLIKQSLFENINKLPHDIVVYIYDFIPKKKNSIYK